MKIVSLAFLLFCTYSSAWADEKRCEQDIINKDDELHGRNRWSFKCGYINERKFDFAESESLYPTYSQGVAPKDGDAACDDQFKGKFLALCNKGCVTPEQRYLFGEEYIAIETAAKLGKSAPFITTLDGDKSLTTGQMGMKTLSVEAFVSGLMHGKILQIETELGHKLRVTPEHPLVLSSGMVVRADKVKRGTFLLNKNLRPVRVSKIEKLDYTGSVWNLRPASRNKAENILVLEGLLTGSLRYQNAWAKEAYRLSLRDGIQL